MIKKYRVVFLNLLTEEKDFKEGMNRLGVSPPVVDQIISKAPVVLKGDMVLGEARRYADAIQLAGGRVNIQECGFAEDPEERNRSVDIRPLEDFIMCPECGYKQLKVKTCKRCGLILEKGR